MRTFEHTDTREAPERLPESPERVEEIAERIVVPDDLSGLEFEEPTRFARGTRVSRWLPWIAVFALLVGGAAFLATLVFDDGSDPLASDYTKAQVMIQESIDAALAERQALRSDFTTAQVMIQESIDLELAKRQVEYTTAQVMIQESIDEALAERQALRSDFTKAQRMIQDSIDEALAERGR